MCRGRSKIKQSLYQTDFCPTEVVFTTEICQKRASHARSLTHCQPRGCLRGDTTALSPRPGVARAQSGPKFGYKSRLNGDPGRAEASEAPDGPHGSVKGPGISGSSRRFYKYKGHLKGPPQRRDRNGTGALSAPPEKKMPRTKSEALHLSNQPYFVSFRMRIAASRTAVSSNVTTPPSGPCSKWIPAPSGASRC